jgi:HD-GYP domain-containing protein (c-di-GMP phosphodiesterase class II)
LPDPVDPGGEAGGDSVPDPADPISLAIPDRPAVCCHLETSLSRRFDDEILGGADLVARPQGEPFAAAMRTHGDRLYDKEITQKSLHAVEKSSQQLSETYSSLRAGNSTGLHAAELITRHALVQVAEDRDLFVCLGIQPTSRGYPSRHSMRVSMLAMAIGTTLGWDARTLADLGIGCLLHDVGMLEVPAETYGKTQILAYPDFARIAQHPVLTMEALARHIDRIPHPARLVAYQMHERCNGTGYPRGYSGSRIHELAKVAAVADVFVALVSPRPHRPPLVPYHALKKILYDTKAGLYDSKVVRALLKTTSLFPIGSCVALSDGRVGRVIRSTGDAYDRPIVEAWKPDEPSHTRSVVDLSGRSELRITGAPARLG